MYPSLEEIRAERNSPSPIPYELRSRNTIRHESDHTKIIEDSVEESFSDYSSNKSSSSLNNTESEFPASIWVKLLLAVFVLFICTLVLKFTNKSDVNPILNSTPSKRTCPEFLELQTRFSKQNKYIWKLLNTGKLIKRLSSI